MLQNRVMLRLSLILTIVAAVLGLVGGLVGNSAIAVIGASLTIVGAVFQYLLAKPFIKHFAEKDWIKCTNEYTLSIPAWRHLRGHGVSAKVYESIAGSYEVVICDEIELKDGSFMLRASKPFLGRAVIK